MGKNSDALHLVKHLQDVMNSYSAWNGTITDNRPPFKSQFLQNFLRSFSIDHIFTHHIIQLTMGLQKDLFDLLKME